VAKQGYLAPNDHGGAGSQGAFNYCRSLYALALMFPPKLSSHTHLLDAGLLVHAQQPVVHEAAVQAVTQHLVHQRRRHCTVHAPRQRTDRMRIRPHLHKPTHVQWPVTTTYTHR
jgi:hypothetical protein